MKTNYKLKLTVLLFVSILAACNSKVKKENEALLAETILLKQANDEMRSEKNNLEASIDNYKVVLKEIDDNLQAVDLNATMFGKIGTDGESEADQKETILARISSIKALLDNSKLKIIALDKSLKELRFKYGEQSEQVLAMSEEIKAQSRIILEKETEFLIMQGEMQEDMSELQFSYDQQLILTNELKRILNRGYYFAGTSKELKDKEITDFEGGFIGLGRVKILNANSKEGLFTQVKKDITDTISVKGKFLKFITDRPEGAYQLVVDKSLSQIIILDQEAFWKSSNYLVIEIK